ncbi:hypothetical protein GCM10023314_04750 [Algibacter agarivorans]|uniref:Gliding motility-associated C-terminal domain-containing protein n=1 Tax=Algibacter agarivorans TaxID=1109741 RepID=A0ABP9GAK4_9FLAO
MASGNTGNILETSTPNWLEYGLVFQTLAGQNTVILKMVNNGSGGCGNDLAIDDIEFKTCGDLTTVEDTSNNNSNIVCGLLTPYADTLTAIPDNSVFSTHFYQWQESTNGNTWTDITGETNQTIAISGVVSTMYYRSKVSESIITLNNSQCNTLSDVYQVTVDPIVPPTFIQVPAICSGDTLVALSTTSNESITGTWSPALNNTTTTTYTFTPDTGQCATSQMMTITVNPITASTFTQVSAICNGDTLSALPTTSNEGITGVWNPALDNTTTTTYTFTPDAGQCAASQTMTITVNPITASTFNQVSSICSGDSLLALPTTSNEGITGTWSPALDNTITTTYTFTPDAGQCAGSQMMTITVNPITTPTFTQVSAICNGDALATLPTTSNEGITGTWTPALDNTTTTTYTFTSGIGQCALNQTMTITVNPIGTPTFNQIPAICSGDTLSALPTTSNEGITGMWSPALDNTITTTYIFTPDPQFCPSQVSLTIDVFENPIFSLQNEYFLCFDLNAAIVSPITIDTGLNTTMYNFTWLLNGVIIAGANHGTYIPITGGNYEVIVQNLSTMCSKMVSTLVTVLTEPNFEADVTTDAFTKNQTIEITTISIGDFEYQLDAASWQDEPIFNNVSIGEHIVTVRDKRGCIESSRTVFIIGYPKYFTPNGDGYNETWNIVGPTSPINSLASAEIYIYNRYGKLLKQINPTGEGWNGVYNGVKMSSDDYWFIVEYNEPNSGERKEFKAHFALKR